MSKGARSAFEALLLITVVLVTLVPAAASAPQTQPQTVVQGARFPTNMAFAPDGRLFYTEKDTGHVRILQNGKLLEEPFVAIPVHPGGETGLLGIALDPDFANQPWVYLYLSYKPSDTNRIVRARAGADANVASQVEPVIELLSTQSGYHNGGDIAFGPDNMLYATVGEIHEDSRAQNPDDLGGKILRITPAGTSPEDNPFGKTPVYSIGHRNSFGICFDPNSGDLWETENGPDSHDEVNRIQAGGNYGWPEQLGPGGEPPFIDPVLDYPTVIVPTGCAFWKGDLWFGDFSGRLWSYDPASVSGKADVMATLPAGITDLEVGPDDALYASTADSIVVFGRDASSPAIVEEAATPAGASSGRAPIAEWIAAGVALLAVIIGGLWFSRMSRRDPSD